MELSDRAEEILETLWVEQEEEKGPTKGLHMIRDDASMSELIKLGLVKVTNENIFLTEKGREEAEYSIRRHRLAERLLFDILDVEKSMIDQMSCRFEHVLHEGIEDNVCILLGHPRVCPHGKPIPEGRCCRDIKKAPKKIVTSLSELSKGDRGEIAYLHSKDSANLNKLISMGILPGMQISIVQRFPSYIFQVSQTQFAVDKELAKDIYVRLMGM